MRQFQIQPSQFWDMAPRHFWWLVETLNPPGKGVSLSDEDRAEFIGWLQGNDNGGF